MAESDSQRLQAINMQLMNLYVQLHGEVLDVPQEKTVRSAIYDLESERETLPHHVRYDAKVQQYIVILQSAASNLQLYRQDLQPFTRRGNISLSADEIRQKNILMNKLKSAEKKVATYKQQLSDLGLLPFQIDSVLLDGYREQNQRRLQQLLRNLEATAIDYLLEYYEHKHTLPENFYGLLMSWEQAEQGQQLQTNEIQLLKLWNECVRSGIPQMDIVSVIDAVGTWSDETKQQHLEILQTKLSDVFTNTDASNIAERVNSWIQQYDNGVLTSPSKVDIVMLVKKLRMYGVGQKRIDAVFEGFDQPQNLLKKMNRLFRRD